MNYRKLLAVSFLLFSILFPGYAQDENVDESDDELFELFDVSLEDMMNVGMVSASKKAQSVLDAPATAVVVTRDEIFTRGYRDLIEVLQDIPEVELQINSNPEFRNMASFRAVSGNEKILILLNGIRITPATGDWYTFASQFSVVNAQRIEIILGPASALYGVDAFAGIINIITENHSGGDGFQGLRLNSSYGVYNTLDNSFLAGAKIDKLKVSIAGSFYKSDEPDYNNLYKTEYAWYNNQFKNSGAVIENPFYNDIRSLRYFRESASGSFHGDTIGYDFGLPTESHFLNVDISYGDFSAGYIRHQETHHSSHGIRPWYTAYDKNAWVENTQDVIYMNHNYNSFNGKWNLQTTLRHSLFEIDPTSNYVNSLSRYQRGFFYSIAQSSKIQEQLQVDVSNKLSVTAGVNAEFLTSLPKTALSPAPIDNSLPLAQQDIYMLGASGYSPQILNDTFDLNEAFDQKLFFLTYQNYGAYAQAQWAPSNKVEVTAGGRYDYSTRFGGSVNPRIGLVLKPNKKLHIKALYGEAFLAPSPTKAYAQGGAFYNTTADTAFADVFRIPTPNLMPEKLRSAEVSASYFITSNFSISANAYMTFVDDAIDIFGYTFDPNKVNAPPNLVATRYEFSQNVGETDIRGVTARASYLFKRKKWKAKIWGAFSMVDAINYEYDFENDTLDKKNNREKYAYFHAFLTFKGGIDIMHKNFSISPRVRWTNETYSNIEDILGNKYYNEGYAVLNVTARYYLINKKNKKLSIMVKGSNVTNARYFNVYAGGDEGMPLTPQDPVRIDGGITLEL